jgi:predicted permease
VTVAAWLRLFRLLVRAARYDAADLRRPDAEATFNSLCDAAAHRGPVALTITAVRELTVIAHVIALSFARAVPKPHLPGPVESVRGIRIAVRCLFRSHRGYVAMATFVLGVAVGVNLLVFTIVNALWIRPLPFPEPDKVATITNDVRGTLDDPRMRIFEGGVAGQLITTDQYAALHPRIEVGGRYPETLGVTSDYFKVLALDIRGRDFTADDEREGAEPVAIISDRLWSAAFARRWDVIGSVVPAQPFSIRIVGIASPDFAGARRGEQADMWIPLSVAYRLAPSDWKGRLPLMVFGRVGPRQTVSMADQRYWELTNPELREFYQQLQIRMDLRPRVVPVAGAFGTPDTRTFMIKERDAALVVGGLALLVLLGGCATIAALVLVHYERRRAELAVKMSLGASRRRLVCELLRDVSLVAALGSVAGLVVAALGVRAVPSMSLPGGVDLGRLNLSIDWRVCVVAITATIVTMLASSVLPIARATRTRIAGELVSASWSTTLASERVRQALLALQVCATIIVLVAAGLFVRMVIHGFRTAPGFDVDRTVFVAVQERSPLVNNQITDREAFLTERNNRLRRALRAVPEVTEVAVGPPPLGSHDRIVIKKLRANDRILEGASIGLWRGSPELLSALGVPILAGRSLTISDSQGPPFAAVISQSLAKRLWPDGTALGQPLSAPNSRAGPFLVVGIAPDLPFGSLTEPGNGVVVTARQIGGLVVSNFVVRTGRPTLVAGHIRRTIQGQVVNVLTGSELVARDLGRQRLGAWFFSGFGIAALLLGIGGAFGLVAYLAEAQRREFGVRLALGATMGHLLRQGVAAALIPVSAGLVAGLFFAALVSRLFTALLAGISTLDVATYVGVAITTLGCATAAALAAAWRLRRTSPSDALRAI